MAFDWQAELTAPLGNTAVNHASSAVTKPPPPKPVQKIYFAQALTASATTVVSNDNLPQPLIRGDTIDIQISQEIYEKDFNMHKQHNTHAQVWIRLLELPQEYWMDRTLREISSVVGTPLLIDSVTIKRIYGHYARILVDMDFSRQIFHEITVEREGYAFQVEVAYEWLLYYRTHCHTIGHDVSSCRWLYPPKDNIVHKEKIVQGKKPVPTPKQTWIPTKDNSAGIGSSISFAVPQTNTNPVITEAEAHPITLQQQDTTNEVVNHETIFVEEQTLSATMDLEQQNLGSDTIEGDIGQHLEHNVTKSSPPLAPMVNHTLDVSHNSFSMPLTNVIDVVARSTIVVTHDLVITPVEPLDVNTIRADPDATVDPTLQKILIL
ncbi:DUF4283 domain protein [Medicago truncatula]|uniref:DUF4283 domain protein n=1 Tax=Medicago truncatula TaxID=3880 RepID=A0A072U9K4_MEDTR|nr:DUF4283 domain protein [Medicago truncatula]